MKIRDTWRVPLYAILALAACKDTYSRDEWIEKFESLEVNHQASECKPGGYRLRSFDVDEATCKATLSSAIKECFESEKASIPERLDDKSVEDAKKTIRECADKKFAEKHPVRKQPQ